MFESLEIRSQKWFTVYKDRITLGDYEIHDGMAWSFIISTKERAMEGFPGCLC